MYAVIDRDTGQRVATFYLDPYKYTATSSAGAAVEQTLEDVRTLTQTNRTTFEDEPAFGPGSGAPDDAESTADDGGTSMEAPQDPSDDHILRTIARRLRTGYLVIDGSRRTTAATRYSEGEKVVVGDTRAIVVEIWTSGDDREGPDGDTWNPSEDSPVYIVATQDGAEAAQASDIRAEDWSTERDSPDDELAEHVAGDAEAEAMPATIQATLDGLDDDFDPWADGTLEAGPTDWDYPDSWDESDVPNRLILLDAWSSMGGQFDCGGGCCKGTMMSGGMSDGASDRFCAAMKDRVLMWEGWRQGG